MSFTPFCLFLEGLLYESSQAGIAEALLTCVFQGSVIWNSQMSPWQMNGNTGVMEVGIHALCRLFLSVHQGCWGLWYNSVALFGPPGLTATQRSSTSTVTWPKSKPSSSSWQAADHTSNVRDTWVTPESIRRHGACFVCDETPQKRRFFGLKRALFICKLPHCAGDRELIQEVLFDAVVTAPLEAYWTGLALNKSE